MSSFSRHTFINDMHSHKFDLFRIWLVVKGQMASTSSELFVEKDNIRNSRHGMGHDQFLIGRPPNSNNPIVIQTCNGGA